MRVRKKKNGLTVNAVAGSHVVFLGMNLAPSKRKGFRGFGFKRTDPLEGETVWLRGLKTFEATAPHPAPGETFSTRDHPIQGFQWSDFAAKPDRDYVYTVVALYGKPDALEARVEIDLPMHTEPETGQTHSVFFNRGSVATQEYARRYQNKKPSVAGEGAYEWLSRGLLEAFIAFLGEAKKGWSIHGAIYEFQWPAAIKALTDARKRGVNVQVIFDDIETYKPDGKPSGPWQKNRNAIAAAKAKNLCLSRSNGKLMHNKFFVLSRPGNPGKPEAVWTGSTNLTENGIFGHSNLGHIVRDRDIARGYFAYWQRLKSDLAVDNSYRSLNVAVSATPPEPWEQETVAIFSPRGTNLDALQWYAEIAGAANKALMMTFAFGMHPSFQTVYDQKDGVLRMALMEGTTRSPASAKQDAKDIARLRRQPNVVVAIGNRIVTNSFDRWLKELPQVSSDKIHIHWIHTKYMLVDPLSAEPIVVSGSANFSKASTDTNDENMLIIRGNKRIADIYFGEYLRLYNHYSFREAVKRDLDQEKIGEATEWTPQFLDDSDDWMRDYFAPDDPSARFLRREYFAGPMSV
jgi:phosphatidylserine/phosphatidylglycerophosphate/cardiolipin synthase-like enzyme